MHALAEPRQPPRGDLQGMRIAIQSEEVAVRGRAVQDALGVTAGPDRAVHISAPRPRLQGGEHWMVKYRGVRSGIGRVAGRAHPLPRGEIELCEAPGVRLRIRNGYQLCVPGGGAPDLEVLPGTDHGRLTIQAGIFA